MGLDSPNLHHWYKGNLDWMQRNKALLVSMVAVQINKHLIQQIKVHYLKYKIHHFLYHQILLLHLKLPSFQLLFSPHHIFTTSKPEILLLRWRNSLLLIVQYVARRLWIQPAYLSSVMAKQRLVCLSCDISYL